MEDQAGRAMSGQGDADGESTQGAARTAVDKALEVLSAFPAGDEEVGVSELARRLGLTKSTVFRLLAALERSGLVERVGPRYRLGTRLFDLGARVFEPVPGELHSALAPIMARLYEASHLSVNLGVARVCEVVLLGRLDGQHPVPRVLPVGTRFPAHASALGKAILAHDPDRADDVVNAGLRPRTADTIISAQRLRHELAGIRRTGVAFSVREARSDLSCVATALLDEVGRPLAALSLSGPAHLVEPAHHAALLRRSVLPATLAARKVFARQRRALDDSHGPRWTSARPHICAS